MSIMVHQPDQPTYKVEYRPPERRGSSSPRDSSSGGASSTLPPLECLHLSYHDGEHYNSVRPVVAPKLGGGQWEGDARESSSGKAKADMARRHGKGATRVPPANSSMDVVGSDGWSNGAPSERGDAVDSGEEQNRAQGQEEASSRVVVPRDVVRDGPTAISEVGRSAGGGRYASGSDARGGAPARDNASVHEEEGDTDQREAAVGRVSGRAPDSAFASRHSAACESEDENVRVAIAETERCGSREARNTRRSTSSDGEAIVTTSKDSPDVPATSEGSPNESEASTDKGGSRRCVLTEGLHAASSEDEDLDLQQPTRMAQQRARKAQRKQEKKARAAARRQANSCSGGAVGDRSSRGDGPTSVTLGEIITL